MADVSGHFMRVERESGDGGSRHFVVHVRDPKFAVEMVPDTEAEDRVGSGVIKRVSLPNSWAGNYGQYAALLKAAQEFFPPLYVGPACGKDRDAAAQILDDGKKF